MELGIFIKEAMHAAGKPFRELSPEQLGAALRDYEVLRSHRVSHIIAKSGFMGNLFLFMGFLVRALYPLALKKLLEGPCSGPIRPAPARVNLCSIRSSNTSHQSEQLFAVVRSQTC